MATALKMARDKAEAAGKERLAEAKAAHGGLKLAGTGLAKKETMEEPAEAVDLFSSAATDDAGPDVTGMAKRLAELRAKAGEKVETPKVDDIMVPAGTVQDEVPVDEPVVETPPELAKKLEPTGKAASVERAGVALVTRHYTRAGKLYKTEEEEPEQIEIGVFAGPTASVGMIVGETINMGDYESIKVSVSCTVPTYAEEADEAYLFAREFATSRLSAEAKGIRSMRDGE